MTERNAPSSVEPPDLRARLLGVEPPDVGRLEQLQRKVRAVFIQELDRKGRFWWSVSLIVALASAAFGGVAVAKINAPASVASPGVLRAVWGLFTLASLASAGYACRVLYAGRLDLRDRLPRTKFKLAVTLAIAILLIVQAESHPSIPMLGWALFGVMWVIVAAANRVASKVTAAELATREAMLRLELRLAQAADRR